MEKNFESKWLDIIGNKENALVAQKSGLEARFVYLLAMMGVAANYFINHIKLKFYSNINLDQRMGAFFILVLIVFWIVVFINFSNNHLMKCKQNKMKNSQFRRKFLPWIFLFVAIIHGSVNTYADHAKINNPFLLIPFCLSFLASAVLFYKPDWFDWYISNSLKGFESRYDISVRLIFLLICLGTILLLLVEYGIFAYVWKAETFLDIQSTVSFWFLLLLAKKAYDTQIVDSELQSIRDFQSIVISNKFKTEEELKNNFVKILSEGGS